MNKLFFVVPVYNVEEYLKRCVDSILSQTYPYIDIVLVDDGSPDNCPPEFATIMGNHIRISR